MKINILNYFLVATLFIVGFQAKAAQVDTVEIFSNSMGKKIKAVIVFPENHKKPVPTLYLLHGYSGNYANWVNKVPYIKTLVDRYNYAIVCPDGGYGSWYWDIEGDKNNQYETFVSKELVAYVESQYAVCQNRESRAISGLSMGGHGALYVGIRHQDVYGAIGSTAGGVDFRPFPNSWEIIERLGTYSENKEVWDKHVVMEMLHEIKPNNLKLFIDCGTDDFFYNVNRTLHEKMTYLNIPHTFVSMPGKHNWDYWSQSISLQMAFFDQFFRN
ncbi:alpha/beta hydrolase [Sphingobacterium faecale]|uniref:Esterase family protein n=1 Tax=Sphingobacterium faecale TaxID=2803775 RepID=A0ABS1R335_9SPHI|nr:alpha/beta hydrolase family protein [Sphingobacterium faecale]MBL1409108.1 esterase family protein [Sphingobacterium faecale]